MTSIDTCTSLIYRLASHTLLYYNPKLLSKLWLHYPTFSMLSKNSRQTLKKLGLPPEIAQHISQQFESTLLKKQLAWLACANHDFICIDDPCYPPQLRHIEPPIPALYTCGDISLLHSPQLAVVGTRRPSPYGLQITHVLSAALSAAHLTVSSGLASGIDSQAHQAALQSTGHTIAVLGCGVNRCYPKHNQKLMQEIIAQGCLVSEYPLDTPPLAAHFPHRNRIISGLSLGCLVIEARKASGSLITARLALEQNKEVFAIPGQITQPNSQGCHHLIKQGAKLVEIVEDIIVELPTWVQENAKNIASTVITCSMPETNLSPLAKEIYQALNNQGATRADILLHQLKIQPRQLNQALLELELTGLMEKSQGYCWGTKDR